MEKEKMERNLSKR